VTILDLGRSRGAEIASDIGSDARFVEADVTSEEQVGEAVEQALHDFGPLRILINCAGIGSAARTVGKDGQPFDLAIFRKTIEVNLIGSFNVTRLAAAKMAANEPDENGERGAIVNTASAAAFEGQIGQARRIRPRRAGSSA
jgi:NAD(P)-dependent dehydrogenase (short-subunit alcohol dehydrogenase family)